MFVQLLCFILILLFGQVYSRESNNNRKNYIIACSLVVLLKAALRSVTVGRDTSHYAYYFYESMNTPWAKLFSDFGERYKHLGGSEDVGYNLLEKFFSSFIPDFNVYTFFIQGLLFYIPMGLLVYRYSKNNLHVMFAYTLFNALFMGLLMANARQVYSIGLCIWAFLSLGKKKYVTAAIFVALAYFIHASALLFVLPIILSFINIKMLRPISVIAFLLSFVVLAMPNTVILFMASMIESEKYMGYGLDEVHGGAITYIVLSLLLCAFCIYGFFKTKNLTWDMKVCYMMLPLTTFFTPLIYSNGSMMRITIYFQIFFMLLVPYTIDIVFSGRDRTKWYYIMIVILIVMSVVTANDYRFFWEESQDPLLHWS